MTIKKEDLNLLIRIENFLGTNFPRGSEGQDHKCAYCGGEIPDMKSAHADHIVPWSKGGKTEYGNLQILCVKCNCKKSAEQEAANTREFSIKQ